MVRLRGQGLADLARIKGEQLEPRQRGRDVQRGSPKDGTIPQHIDAGGVRQDPRRFVRGVRREGGSGERHGVGDAIGPRISAGVPWNFRNRGNFSVFMLAGGEGLAAASGVRFPLNCALADRRADSQLGRVRFYPLQRRNPVTPD